MDVISYVDIVKPENSAKKTADPLSASAVTASFNDAKKLYYDKLKAKNKTATAVAAPAPAPLFALPTFFHDFDQACPDESNLSLKSGKICRNFLT